MPRRSPAAPGSLPRRPCPISRPPSWPRLPRELPGAAAAARSRLLGTGLRLALFAVGVAQAGLAWPALASGTAAMSAPVHVAHETGAWNLAVAAAFVAVAAAPRLAAGALPFLGTFALLLLPVTLADLGAGHVHARPRGRASAAPRGGRARRRAGLAGTPSSGRSHGGRTRGHRTARGRVRRATALLLALVTGWLLVGVLTAGPAAAHAVLVSTDPAEGASLEQPPDRVTLSFSEPVSLGAGYARLLDADGTVHPTDASVTGDTLTIEPRSELPDDRGYLVTYRVMSADSHPISGAFSFVVGDAELVPLGVGAGVDPTDPVVGTALPIARWAGFAGLALGDRRARSRPGVLARRLGVRPAAAAGGRRRGHGGRRRGRQLPAAGPVRGRVGHRVGGRSRPAGGDR